MGLFGYFCAFGACLFMFSDATVVRLTACPGVEYPRLGCFDLRPPFTNTRWLPQSPDFVGTTFKLFTRQNREEGADLDADHVQTIRNSHFDASKQTKLLVHGYFQYPTMQYLINTTRSLLAYGDMNVIVVGWTGGARSIYSQSAANTRLVGAQVARLITVLSRQTGLTADKVHIIGHSLGAHVAGYAGARTPGMARITALDPAQPNFHGYRPEVRLDETDAQLVDVIHTDASPYNTVGGYGMIEPVGHIDFYPNGGHNQPGCQDESSVFGLMEDAVINGVSSAEHDLSCSHERSVHLFAASIESHGSCSFTAVACDSEAKFLNGECIGCGNAPCPVMGLHADRSQLRGVFYLNTSGSDPFCSFHYFINVTLDDSWTNAAGTVEVKLTGRSGHTDWTVIKSGAMNGGEIISKLFLSGVDTGSISNVKIRYTNTASSLFWGTETSLRMSRVKAINLKRVHPKFFCQPNMVVEDGQVLTLSSGSFHGDTCN